MYEEERNDNSSDGCDNISLDSRWRGKDYYNFELKSNCISQSDSGSNNIDSNWDTHFPALSMKPHNTFTLTPGKYCDHKKELFEINHKSAGDTQFKVPVDMLLYILIMIQVRL